ncbi:FAD/NAD(P)-binding domain-containing protein [Exidia glandulosa HHB12029]|uniref:FAD/NAD(P)-binding domain-containing protein n=1 Tax=Exidia glandulosa HHB12029 TaxID=1314781 RepID=A0A165DAR6_EXIGL|nr:FAD/NAD(P)-binding domain-containing protein [Exidia glandulosa HHB12029]
MSLPVLISGTGPAALLFAQKLLHSSPRIPFHLYERDLSLVHRKQGYRFTVSGKGVCACRNVLSPEHFELLRDTAGHLDLDPDAKRIDAHTGEWIPSLGFTHKRPAKEEEEEDPEPLPIDRTLMRQVLFRGLEEYTTFGKEVVGYDTDNAESGVIVRFADGSTVHGALLVGADGAYSRVGAQLNQSSSPRTRLLDTEMRMIFGKTPFSPELYAALPEGENAQILQGVTFVADPSPRQSPLFFMMHAMRFTHRGKATAADPSIGAVIPRDYLYWALALRSDEPDVQGVDWLAMDASSAGDFAETVTKDWIPSLRAIVTHRDPVQTTPLLSAVTPLPLTPFASEGQNRMVTLIGDAAHAMPPTSATGVTTALRDAEVLSTALAEYGVSHRALEVYEAQMRAYATEAIEASINGGKKVVGMRDMQDLKRIQVGH